MYARPIRFCVADVSSIGTGQAHTVHGAAAVAQEAAKANRLRNTGFVRYWLDDARPSGTPQGHARMVG
jgi:hypothetical protein